MRARVFCMEGVQAIQKGPGIREEDDRSFASLDGKHRVELPTYLARNIALALKTQEKIDEALLREHRPGFLRTISMLNCRKSVSAVRGTVPLQRLVSREVLKNETLSEAEAQELAGLTEVWEDVEHNLESGNAPILGTSEDLQIASYLDEHPGTFPAAVHVFNAPPKLADRIVTKVFDAHEPFSVEDAKRLNRNHTFLVLGKDDADRYVCFQKEGASIYDRFELRDLESLLAETIDPEEGVLYVSFVEPILADEEFATDQSLRQAA